MGDGEKVDIQEVMRRAACAAAVFSQCDQAHTDRIVQSAYRAAFKERVRLAMMAHDETGIGKWRDKVIKNVLATQFVYEDIKDVKTVGVIGEDRARGIVEIAQPLGPILAITPITNPTSTTIFKILIALKTRNPIIIRPHRGAAKSSIEAARICYEAALAEDAPEDCVQWVGEMSREDTQALMSHKDLALVLATGGPGLVKAAYSSGTPAIGVGAGNVPVYIERSADVEFAVEQILASKTFDNGTVCASEQAVVVETPLAAQTIDAFRARHAHVLSAAEIARLEPVAYDRAKGNMQADIVGKPAWYIARKAGFDVPEDTSVLLAPLPSVGDDQPLSSEILAPILAYYEAPDFEAAVKLCIDLNYHGGLGHTASIFSNDEARILEFSTLMNAGRIVVNTPSSQGAVGGVFNTLSPSFTLGCGTGGKNITTDNITARHLINVQRIARRRVHERFARFDASLYYDEALGAQDIEGVFSRNA